MTDPVIAARRLAFAYPRQAPLFHDVSFTLAPGEILTLLGPNGVGKSTLLACLTGRLTASAGEVTVTGQPLPQITTRELARQLALVPQDYRSGADLTVEEFVLTGRAPYHLPFSGPSREDYRLVSAELARLDLLPLAHRKLRQLSGGQAQLVAIARALVQHPRCLLLDEPMAALDLGRQQALLTLLLKLRQRGVAIIITTHLPNHALILGGQTGLFFPDGHFTVGASKQVMTGANLSTLYQTNLKVFFAAALGRWICEPTS